MRLGRITPHVVQSATPAPTELRPELVPNVKIVKVLPNLNDPTVVEPEHNAVANVKALAVSLPAAALDADHVVVVIGEQVPQLGPERPCGLLS